MATSSAYSGPSRTAGQQPVEDGEFMLIRGVPVFAEHETRAKDGRTLKFGRAELEAVAARNNERISVSGDYVPITIGHTPDPMAVMLGKAQQPEVVGFAGPFTLGRIGPPGQERYSIMADFRVFKEDWNRVRKFPRRSPELWLEDSYDKMFLDPICLLGAETPRLDMGVLYSASLHGKTVEKYTAVSPGPSNAFVPSENYQADDDDDGDGDDDDRAPAIPPEGDDDTSVPPDKDAFMNEEQLVSMFLEAFRQSDMGQWIMQQMQRDQAPQPSVPQPPVPTTSPASADPSAPIDNQSGGGMTGPGDPSMQAPSAMNASMPPDDSGATGGMMGLPNSNATGGTPPPADREKMGAGQNMMPYARAGGDRLSAMEQRVTQLEGQLEDERRIGLLMELAATGVQIENPRDLVQTRLNYQRATPDQFRMVIENYARQARLPLMNTFLPTPDGPGMAAAPGPERYNKSHSDQAMAICNDLIRQGKPADYMAVLRQVQSSRS